MSDDEVVFIVESGEYSDYQYHALFYGPRDADIEALYAEGPLSRA